MPDITESWKTRYDRQYAELKQAQEELAAAKDLLIFVDGAIKCHQSGITIKWDGLREQIATALADGEK